MLCCCRRKKGTEEERRQKDSSFGKERGSIGEEGGSVVQSLDGSGRGEDSNIHAAKLVAHTSGVIGLTQVEQVDETFERTDRLSSVTPVSGSEADDSSGGPSTALGEDGANDRENCQHKLHFLVTANDSDGIDSKTRQNTYQTSRTESPAQLSRGSFGNESQSANELCKPPGDIDTTSIHSPDGPSTAHGKDGANDREDCQHKQENEQLDYLVTTNDHNEIDLKAGQNINQTSKTESPAEKTESPAEIPRGNFGHESQSAKEVCKPPGDIAPTNMHSSHENSNMKPSAGNVIHDSENNTDPVAAETYRKACLLLHRSLIQREKSLTESERDFLGSLISSLPTSASADQLSDVESAVHVLETDPLFQENLSASSAELERAEAVEGQTKGSFEVKQETSRSSRSHKFSKNRVELAVIHNDEVEVSALKGKGESLGSSVGSIPTVTERNQSASSLASQHQNSNYEVLSQNEGSPKRSCTPADLVDAHTSIESSNKKLRMADEEVVEKGRFDGWSSLTGEEYDAVISPSFRVLGTSATDESSKPHVLSPPLMEALRGFFPFVASEDNFWMKFSLVRDGSSLTTLLSNVRGSVRTIIAIETVEGDVFGSFTGSAWRKHSGYYGSGEAFLWRLKKSRLAPLSSIAKQPFFDSEMEVYPYTGTDTLVQYCTDDSIAVGGGDWLGNDCPYEGEPKGIGLQIDADLERGESSSCATFANPRLCKHAKHSTEFDILNLEVWTLSPCYTEQEAEKLELRKLFVEDNRQM